MDIFEVHLFPRYDFQPISFLIYKELPNDKIIMVNKLCPLPSGRCSKWGKKRFAITWWCSKGEAMMQTQSQCWAKIYQICNLQFDDGTWCQIPSVPTYLEFMILKLKLNFSRKMSKTSFVVITTFIFFSSQILEDCLKYYMEWRATNNQLCLAIFEDEKHDVPAP